MNRNLSVLLGILATVIASLWTYMNFTYSTGGLPLGWDTPYYAWKINSAAGLGTAGFISAERYYHILYPMVGGLISVLGIDAFSIEKVLPAIMWVAGFLAIVAIVARETGDWKAVIIAAATGSTWFGFFRLASDLHAAILSLVLMLVATSLFLRLQGTPYSRRFFLELLVLGTLVLGSSFAHTEVTLFILSIWILALSLRRWRKLIGTPRYLSIVLTILLAIVPGLVIYWNQLLVATSPLGGRLPSISTMTPIIWIAYVGPVGLIVLIALLAVYRSVGQLWSSSPLATLTVAWLVLTLALGLVQYVDPRLTPFSERAVILTPTPFLTTIIMPRLRILKMTTSQGKALILIAMVITGGAAFYNVFIGPYYYSSYITDSASAALQKIRSNGLIDVKRTIFILNEAEPFAGGLAEHNNHWVDAFLGDHFAYLGRIDFLLAGFEAPFSNDQSNLISRVFFSQLPVDKIPNMTIVYVTDFNVPRPVPSYYLSFLSPLTRGAYMVDQAKWRSQNQIIIPAYTSILMSSEGWRSEPQDWTLSGSSLKFDSKIPNQVATAAMSFAVHSRGQYKIQVRAWDALTSNPLSVSLDRAVVGRFSYNGTLAPIEPAVFSGTLEAGLHTITLAIDNQANLPQFASIDYVSITKTS